MRASTSGVTSARMSTATRPSAAAPASTGARSSATAPRSTGARSSSRGPASTGARSSATARRSGARSSSMAPGSGRHSPAMAPAARAPSSGPAPRGPMGSPPPSAACRARAAASRSCEPTFRCAGVRCALAASSAAISARVRGETAAGLAGASWVAAAVRRAIAAARRAGSAPATRGALAGRSVPARRAGRSAFADCAAASGRGHAASAPPWRPRHCQPDASPPSSSGAGTPSRQTPGSTPQRPATAAAGAGRARWLAQPAATAAAAAAASRARAAGVRRHRTAARAGTPRPASARPDPGRAARASAKRTSPLEQRECGRPVDSTGGRGAASARNGMRKPCTGGGNGRTTWAGSSGTTTPGHTASNLRSASPRLHGLASGDHQQPTRCLLGPGHDPGRTANLRIICPKSTACQQ